MKKCPAVALIILVISSMVLISPMCHALTQPKFILSPITPTTISLPANGVTTVQYTVTNETKMERTLTMVPIAGITQVDGGSGACSNPFTLDENESCLLTLQINGNSLPESVVGGPQICKTKGIDDDRPDPFLCSQPSEAESLNITRLPNERTSLSISPRTLSLTANGASGTFTVTNHSTTVTANHITALLSLPLRTAGVTQDRSDCLQVPPQTSCSLIIIPGSDSVTQTSFPVIGTNTKPVGASVEVTSTDPVISVTAGNPLTLVAESGVAGSLTIQNNSATTTATSIAADLTGALANAGVTQDSSDCASVAAGATCNLWFTPGNTAVDATDVSIAGSNTSITSASIAVNASGQVTLSVSGSPLRIPANGGTGTMTLTNTSTTTYANNVAANFDSTALSGYVEATTCSSIAPQGTCTMTFTSNNTVVDQTDFIIQGSNTNALTPSLTITAVVGASYEGGIVGCVDGGFDNVIVATTDNSSGLDWSPSQDDISAAENVDDGAANTQAIVSFYGASLNYAAGLCSDYEVDSAGNSPCVSGNTCYTDWFLPAQGQLFCIENNKTSIGNFVNAFYWCSTQDDRGFSVTNAFARDFTDGNQFSENKSSNFRVRCSRNFTPP